ncbi:hypothetical protein GPD46_004881 [Salmonella enterica]|nr:hypothetical protein [Salmonella enterica]
MMSGPGTRRSRKCSFNIRVKNAEQRAGIPGMRQRRIEAPAESKYSPELKWRRSPAQPVTLLIDSTNPSLRPAKP